MPKQCFFVDFSFSSFWHTRLNSTNRPSYCPGIKYLFRLHLTFKFLSFLNFFSPAKRGSKYRMISLFSVYLLCGVFFCKEFSRVKPRTWLTPTLQLDFAPTLTFFDYLRYLYSLNFTRVLVDPLQVKYYGRDPATGQMRLSRKVLTATATAAVRDLQQATRR